MAHRGLCRVIFSFLSKETAAAFLVIIPACDLCLKRRLKWQSYALYGGAFAAYMAIRASAVGGIATVRYHPELSGYECFLNAFYLYGWYFWKLIFPAGLNIAHGFEPARSLTEWRTLAPIAFAAGYAAAVFFTRGIVRLSFIWAAVPLLPVLYVGFFKEMVFGERYLYLPSAAFALLIAYGAGEAVRRRVFGAVTGKVVVFFLRRFLRRIP